MTLQLMTEPCSMHAVTLEHPMRNLHGYLRSSWSRTWSTLQRAKHVYARHSGSAGRCVGMCHGSH